MTTKTDIFLDSGAFSAFTQGVDIDIQEYIDFIKTHQEHLTVYANLDVIGSPEGTWKNQRRMEKAGLMPLPCFHYGEDPKWLKMYLSRGYEYIALGGMVPISTPDLKIWLDDIWKNYLTDAEGMPIIKVHGFGLTSNSLMRRYPWFCMTEEDHKVLTKKGWKGLSELNVGDEILAFNEGISEWQPILEIPIFEVKEEEINHLHNRNFEAFVTDNHRWKISNQSSKNKRYQFRTTDDLKKGDCIDRIGAYEFPKEAVYTDEQIQALAWFWTDGTIKRRPKYDNDSIVIYQSNDANPKKCQMIRDVLNNSKEKFCESNSAGGMISFELYGALAKWLLSQAPEKKLSIELPFLMTKKQSEDFIKYSILADGSKTNLKRSEGFSLTVTRETKKENLEVVRIVCLLLGIPTSVFDNNYKPSRGLLSSSVNHIYVKQLKKEKVKYSGRLWCVRVESGAFFTKCRHKIYVTGNSVDSTSWVMTGRMGGVYVPKFKNGQYDYSEDCWKVQVSNRSPSKDDPGKHLQSFSPAARNNIEQYFTSKGFKVGRSVFRTEKSEYELKENEKWNGKEVAGNREVEEILEAGLCNDYKQRDELNIIYFLDLEKNWRPWPWPFRPRVSKGFSL